MQSQSMVAVANTLLFFLQILYPVGGFRRRVGMHEDESPRDHRCCTERCTRLEVYFMMPVGNGRQHIAKDGISRDITTELDLLC